MLSPGGMHGGQEGTKEGGSPAPGSRMGRARGSSILKDKSSPKSPALKKTLSFHDNTKRHDGDEEDTYGTVPISPNYDPNKANGGGDPPRGCCLVM